MQEALPAICDAAVVAKEIASDFYNDRLDLSARDAAPGSTWARMPEVECVTRLRNSGTSHRTIRLFLTFVAAMDRARDATRLWNNGVELFQSFPEIFEPVEASAIPLSTLRARLSEYGVSQRHGPDSSAWHIIARSLAAGGNPASRVVDAGVGNAVELLSYLRTSCEGQSRFPLLRGPKIGPMWVRMLVAPGGATIDDIDIIPVAVDVHVRRVTGNLRVVDTLDMSEREARQVIQVTWEAAVARTKIGGPLGIADTCAALDPALWLFGKFGCSHCEKVGQPVPIGQACNRCRLRVST